MKKTYELRTLLVWIDACQKWQAILLALREAQKKPPTFAEMLGLLNNQSGLKTKLGEARKWMGYVVEQAYLLGCDDFGVVHYYSYMVVTRDTIRIGNWNADYVTTPILLREKLVKDFVHAWWWLDTEGHIGETQYQGIYVGPRTDVADEANEGFIDRMDKKYSAMRNAA